MTWTITTPRSIPISLTTAIPTCIRANSCFCGSSARAAGSIPFHEHGNHVRILGSRWQSHYQFQRCHQACRPAALHDYNDARTCDGRNLLLDRQGPQLGCVRPRLQGRHAAPCTPDANGYNTGTAAVGAINYYEWCGDHNKPLETNPFGAVAAGGPVTLPDPNILVNGTWYGGSPYLGPDATARAVGIHRHHSAFWHRGQCSRH